MISMVQRVARYVFAFMLVSLVVFASAGTNTIAVAATPQQSTQVDLMLVIDGSGSIAPSDFELARTFAKQVVASCILGTDAQVGVVQFSDEGATRIESKLSKDAAAVNRALNAMNQIQGLTDIQEGLQVAQSQLSTDGRSGSKRFIILLTDGGQSEDGDPVAESDTAKKAGTELFTVGVGTGIDTGLLLQIASDPDATHAYTVSQFSDLASVLGKLLNASCAVPTIPPTDPIVSNPGGGSTPARPAKKRVSDPADVVVVLRPTPNISAARGSTVNVVVEATNRGKGPAGNTIITVPINASVTKLLGVSTSRTAAWVSSVTTDTLVIQTGKLGSGGDVVSATLSIEVLAADADGTALGTRASYTFSDGKGGGKGTSNLPILVAGGAALNREFYALDVAPAAGPAGSEHGCSATVFVPNEPVTFWYNTPDGKVEGLNALTADGEGIINAKFKTTDLAPGTYSMVARGDRSGLTATGTFVVQ